MQVARPQDDDLTRLLARFVCVRIVQANRMDLSLFDFDRDLTFAAFMLNADRTVYGRYGTRSGDGKGDSTMAGLVAALEGALALHAGWPAEKEALAAKRGPAPAAENPEDLRELRRYSTVADFTHLGERNCIHCHQVGRAEAFELRANRKPLTDATLFPWPTPDAVGLSLSPAHRGTVTAVAPGSAAERAGFRAGDAIVRASGQPILSVADIQWVMHRATEPAELAFEVEREGARHRLSLVLAKGWRRTPTLPWRMLDHHLSLADVPALALGVRLRALPEARRDALGIPADTLALEIARGGGRGRRGRGVSAEAGGDGPRAGDVIVSIDGRHEPMTESDVLAHCLQAHQSGDKVALTVVREGQRVELTVVLR